MVRLAIFLEVELEDPAGAADLAEDFAAVCAGEQLGHRGFDFIAEIKVNAGGGVGFLFHAAGIKPGSGATGGRENLAETEAGLHNQTREKRFAPHEHCCLSNSS